MFSQWMIDIQRSAEDYSGSQKMIQDKNGNTYISNNFYNSITVGGIVLKSKGDSDFFVAKYTKSGKLSWIEQGGGSQGDWIYDMKIYSDTLFLTGQFRNNATFLGYTSSLTDEFYSLKELFIIKLDLEKNLIDVMRSIDRTGVISRNIAKDEQGNIYQAGFFWKNISINGININASHEVKGNKVFHSFLIKYNSSGIYQWHKILENFEIYNICIDANNQIHIAGATDTIVKLDNTNSLNINNNLYSFGLIKFDESGTYKKATFITNSEGIYSTINSDKGNNIYLSSRSYGIISILGEVLTTTGNYAGFMAKIDSDYNKIWVKKTDSSYYSTFKLYENKLIAYKYFVGGIPKCNAFDFNTSVLGIIETLDTAGNSKSIEYVTDDNTSAGRFFIRELNIENDSIIALANYVGVVSVAGKEISAPLTMMDSYLALVKQKIGISEKSCAIECKSLTPVITYYNDTIKSTGPRLATYQWYRDNILLEEYNTNKFYTTIAGIYKVKYDDFGCKSKISSPKSITNNSGGGVIFSVLDAESTEVYIYPNPSEGIFLIESSQNINEIRLYDIIGSVIFIKPTNSKQIQMDLSTYKGVYYLKMNNSIVRKVIIN